MCVRDLSKVFNQLVESVIYSKHEKMTLSFDFVTLPMQLAELNID